MKNNAKAEDTVQVVGQTEPVLAVIGDDVILPCTVRNTVGTVNAAEEAVEWQRPDLDPIEVHFLRNRVDYNPDQNPSYRGRTSLFKEEMKNGNVSLKLTRVKRSDDGKYICYIPTLQIPNQKASVKLIVAAASTPNVSILGFDPMGVVLKCEAGGLIHTPEMIWLDNDGTVLPADGSTETGTDSDGRYTVRGHVTIQKTDNNMFTCRVLQQQINHMMETRINVPDQMSAEPSQAWWSVWWSGWGVGGLVGVLTALIVVGVVHYILIKIGFLHWGRGLFNRNPN
ncbi:hypothetical protein DPEC_G00106500 [Dallia pectoralis]|uniref:Uncharacterized protein n=1 Tax=Dallia pectoralis TaxID=75939 RepID=A0ACC2GXW8_DALPE|nr:hypothetical protein DPEC_G00106500 [Dallia pectoralis]